jgi:predicted DNA-binding transcriptional regulator YafY
MSDRSNRLYEIIQMLRGASAPVRAEDLAEELEVTKRTIYRDIVSLQATGVPIEGAAGIGYVMRSGYNLPPLMFTAEEVEAIAVGLSLLGRTGDAGQLQAASRVSGKIADVLPEPSRKSLGHPSLFASQWHAVPGSAVDQRAIREAIRSECKLRLRYRDEQGRVSERIVRPIAMVYYVDSTVLAAWCELRDDFRHFRVDRLASCQALEDRFAGEGDRLRREWSLHHAPGLA